MNVCDLCIYNPPSSCDGKPCTMCPATTNMELEQEPETVTEFADRCRECGAKYNKLLKQGRWIGHREHCENLGVMPSGLGAYEWCSNCDCGIDVREWHRNHYNYCPNCGARMESEE